MIDRLLARLNGSAARDAEEARIRADGYPGRGTVVAAHETGRIRADRREMDVTLDVYLGRSRTFRGVIRPWVRAAKAERLRPGNAVPVAADRNEPGHVVLALDMDEPRSIAGLGTFAGGRGGPKPLEGVDPDPPGPDAGR